MPVLADIGDLFGELAIYIAWAVLIFGSALFRLLRKLLGLGDEAAEQLQRAREARRAAANADPVEEASAEPGTEVWRGLFAGREPEAEPEVVASAAPGPVVSPPSGVSRAPLDPIRRPLAGIESTRTSGNVAALEERLESGSLAAEADRDAGVGQPFPGGDWAATSGLGDLDALDEPLFEHLSTSFEHEDEYEEAVDEHERLGGLTIDRAALRRAVLWSEILGRPVALRSSDAAAGPPGLSA